MARSADDRARLDAAFDRYERAQIGRSREEATAARLALCRLMEEMGWSVPPEVREQMQRDEKTLRRLAEPEGGPVGGLLRPPVGRQPP